MAEELNEILVTDVTAELMGERREEYRAGVDAGTRQGSQRVLQGPVLEQIALELTVQRAVNTAMAGAAHQRETLLAHWQSEAAWWREECTRIDTEFAAFVKKMARQFPK